MLYINQFHFPLLLFRFSFLCVCVFYQVRDGAMSDLQTQLREVLRENELLRRDVRTFVHIHTSCTRQKYDKSLSFTVNCIWHFYHAGCPIGQFCTCEFKILTMAVDRILRVHTKGRGKIPVDIELYFVLTNSYNDFL